MYLDWTSHLTTDEAKKNFEQTVLGAAPVLDRLKFIFSQRKGQIEDNELSVKQFESPSWPYKRAYMDGCKAAWSLAIKYVDLDQQRKPKENE